MTHCRVSLHLPLKAEAERHASDGRGFRCNFVEALLTEQAHKDIGRYWDRDDAACAEP